MYQTISAKDFYQELQSRELSLIDVREADEFAQGHVKGAESLPLSTLEANYGHLDKDQTYYLICKMGGRSAKACDFLSQKGYQVINVQGGVEAYPGDLVQ
ncbi:rhodanese-like domain-containing protein [Streptococcus oricebi]|uniref:Rhodanese-like domain-containing protein n=1 Tax=Streptococcus oricebi TaxID=1547447 RepID=A0ABS5B116_9STRE|nr:rhodanese-like domain-containing protein [Streptococcus oricebi]MBP2622445.1 rhodanese-like domain-containing protein [Streptococcus oricebi]